MGKKREFKENLEDSPGPAQYNPKMVLAKKSEPKFKIGSSIRPPPAELKKIPGPGSYEYEPKSLNNQILSGKFGTEPREKRIKNFVPGPGTYKIPTKIVEAPKYLVQSDEQFQYV